MKIIISKSILENILIQAQPFLEKKDTSQITSHVFINISNSFLTLKATDYEIGYEITTNNLTVIEDGSTTANGKKILDIIKILRDGDISLEVKNEILFISQTNSNFKLPTFSTKDFPEFPTLENKSSISIDSMLLLESLKKITPAIDSNNPKFELNGALIDIQEQKINFASTDTKRLAVVTLSNHHTDELSIILPKKAILEIQKLFSNQIELYYDETNLIIKSEQYIFFTKLINGKYPSYERIIPQELQYNLTLPKIDIMNALKQINTISNEIKITFLQSVIIFEALSDDNIEAKTEVHLETGFTQEFSMAINSRYLIDFLNSIQNSQFTLGLNDGNKPFVLSDDNFKTIVMPIVI